MTDSEREGRVRGLREYHSDVTPHYERDATGCGCGQCNEHVLLAELDRQNGLLRGLMRRLLVAEEGANARADATLVQVEMLRNALDLAILALRNWQPILQRPPDVSGGAMFDEGHRLFTAALAATEVKP